jgi:hypothetical protein
MCFYVIYLENSNFFKKENSPAGLIRPFPHAPSFFHGTDPPFPSCSAQPQEPSSPPRALLSSPHSPAHAFPPAQSNIRPVAHLSLSSMSRVRTVAEQHRERRDSGGSYTPRTRGENVRTSTTPCTAASLYILETHQAR